MIISQDNSDARYQIKAYKPGQITVNETTYSKSFIICADSLITDWEPQSLMALKTTHWQPIIALQPKIVLIGTGQQFKLPSSALLVPLYDAKISVESMDTGAACRTYMALIAEGREVAAALLVN